MHVECNKVYLLIVYAQHDRLQTSQCHSKTAYSCMKIKQANNGPWNCCTCMKRNPTSFVNLCPCIWERNSSIPWKTIQHPAQWAMYQKGELELHWAICLGWNNSGRCVQLCLHIMLNAVPCNQQAIARYIESYHNSQKLVMFGHLKCDSDWCQCTYVPLTTTFMPLLRRHLDADVMDSIPQKQMAPKGTSISNKLGGP